MNTTLRKPLPQASIIRLAGRALVIAFVCLTAASATARGGIIIEIQNLTTPLNNSRSFDVVLVNTGSTSYNVGSDVVEIGLFGSTEAKFTDATTATSTSTTYIYSSSFADDLGISLYASLADKDLTVVDSESDIPFYRVVGAGESYGLAHVTFQDDPLSPLSTDMIKVITEGTSISDESGNIIYPAAVPEPSSLVTFAIGLVGIGVGLIRRKGLPGTTGPLDPLS